MTSVSFYFGKALCNYSKNQLCGENHMKRIGIILVFAIFLQFFASAAESTEKDIENISKTITKAKEPGKAISVFSPE
ncbi:MAG: hypothetical protein HGA93_07040, partial [Methanothrix sp.]|nr:hypothetical protein [Methanothrix sp.]